MVGGLSWEGPIGSCSVTGGVLGLVGVSYCLTQLPPDIQLSSSQTQVYLGHCLEHFDLRWNALIQ